MFYTEITTKIQATLEKVTEIKEIIPYPIGDDVKLNKFPAVVFFPASSENSFETNGDNLKIYRYKIYVIVGGKGAKGLWNTVLPKAVDAVVSQFDEDWDMSLIGSSRATALIDSGNWTSVLADNGVEAIAELNLRIKLINPIK